MSNNLPSLKETTQTFGQKLEEIKKYFLDLVPKHISVERMFRLGQLAMSRQPLLAQCTMSSLLSAMLKAGEMGLEPDGTNAALVPFKNKKTGKMEATLIPMWQGLARLARETGQVSSLDTDVVFEKDEFLFVKGLEPKLEHKPPRRGDRGEMEGTWAAVRYKDGGSDQEWMSKEEIDKIKARSRAKDYGPWVTDYTEMARKTVFRRLAKRLPKSDRFVVAMDADNRFENGEVIDLVALPELPQEAQPEQEPTATEKLAEKTRKTRSDKGTTRKPPQEPPQETSEEAGGNGQGKEESPGEPVSGGQDNNKLADADTVEEIKTLCRELNLDPDKEAPKYGAPDARLVLLDRQEAEYMLSQLYDLRASKQ